MRPIFRGFLHIAVLHWSLTLHFKPFWFWLRIRGDIRNQKTTRRLGESGSHRLSDSASWGVANSLTQWVVESLTLWLGDSGSWLLNVENSPLQWVVDSPSRRANDSPTCQAGELPTRQVGELPARRVRELPRFGKICTIGNLVDSPTRQVRESFFDYKYLSEFEAKIKTTRKVV